MLYAMDGDMGYMGADVTPAGPRATATELTYV